MPRERLYPPDWVDDEEAAYLLSMGASTFRDYVSRGYFPSGVKIGGKRLWSRISLNESLERLASPEVPTAVSKAVADLITSEQAKVRPRRKPNA
jgi:predicted DNA-binding transcriptional regulator AlpA